jgi:multiple sugar transport system permease protein
MSLFPHGAAWANLREAWSTVDVGRYFWNTVELAIGSWFSQLVVATTAGFALSVLRPKYGRVLMGLVLTTLFVPAVVLLVPLYVEIVHPPLIHHRSSTATGRSGCLPGERLQRVPVKRFFDNIPRDLRGGPIDGQARCACSRRSLLMSSDSRRRLRFAVLAS